jgi:3-oxoacyl-[acyl-carrier protein] reductase
MTSAHWDESLAEKYRNFRFQFASKTLTGRTVIVAGGTGGLGAAVVNLLALEGCRAIVGFRSNRERANNLRDHIRNEAQQEIELIEGDISTNVVRAEYRRAAEKAGDSLAGVVILPGDPARVPLETLGEKDMEASFEANYSGPILLAKELGALMEQARGGNVVLMASMQAVALFPSSLNYAGPKAALVHGARVLAQAWKKVCVNVVAPGATVVGMAQSSVSAGKYDKYLDRGSISRFGRPEDVARAVRFFLEPDTYITGQVLVVDGGLTIRREQ